MFARSQKRFVWADVIRVLATYFVICVHLTYVLSPITGSNPVDVAIFSVAKTCVPLFAVLSGALLMSKKDTFITFIKKRLSRLLKPWVFWTSMYTILFFVKTQQSFTVSKFIYEESIQLFTLLWFVPIIFGLYLITPLFRYFFYKRSVFYQFLYIVIWFGILVHFPKLYEDPRFIRTNDVTFVVQVFLYSGFFLWGDTVLKLQKMLPISTQYVLSVVCVVSGLFWTYLTVLHGGGGGSFHYLSGNIALLTLGFYWILILSFSRVKITGFFLEHITRASKLSFGVLFLHILIIQFVLKDMISSLASIPYFISAAVLGIFSYMVLLWMTRVTFLRKIVT
ncbi:MAG: acyltransferase [Candidatus Levybacteria bacterium]|nr:acyltransferase [Candidatus Levybacteria bacterium]